MTSPGDVAMSPAPRRGSPAPYPSARWPLAELENYQGRLKSLTGGKGAYSIAFSHHAQAPGAVQHELARQVQGGGHRRLKPRRAPVRP